MAKRNEITGEPRRSPFLRLLAPIALIATAVILVVVISSSLGSGDSDGEKRSGGGGGGERTQTSSGEKSKKPPKEYVIEPGDSLSAIADRYGVPVTEILDLNPKIDPQALVTGETLKLR